MPFHFGPTELAIILVIVILLFGVGRIGRLGADFGRAIPNSSFDEVLRSVRSNAAKNQAKRIHGNSFIGSGETQY